MKRFGKLARSSKHWRTDVKRPLIENNNNDIRDGYNVAADGYDNPSTERTAITPGGQQIVPEIPLQEVAELLGVTLGANTSEDGSCCSMRPETSSAQQTQKVVWLIQQSVANRLPSPPADLDQNLQLHLSNVQETVRDELVRLSPLLDEMGFAGSLMDCYHRQTLGHLNDLLRNVQSCQSSFVLMKWVLHTYLGQDLLGHPNLQKMEPMEKADLLLLTELVAKVKDKLVDNARKQVSVWLENILQMERRLNVSDNEETCIELYINTIKCINAMPDTAHKISSKLSDDIWEVCCQELLVFLQRFTSEQTEILLKKARLDKPETIHFFKTLKACKEIKQHVQTKSTVISELLLEDIMETLQSMEAFTLKLLMVIVADMAESHLKNYFQSENKQFFFLILGLKTYFPKLSWCQDVYKTVMDEAYKLIAHVYLKHLVRRSQSKLRKCWSAEVGQTVAGDAELLHATIADMAPGVKQWNLLLLKITELLDCKDIDAVKLTVVDMQRDCPTWSEDEELLPALLRWKGLYRWQAREVQELVDDLSNNKPRPRSASWFFCFKW